MDPDIPNKVYSPQTVKMNTQNYPTCSVLTATRKVCGKPCKNDPRACGTHLKSIVRDNPTERLSLTGTSKETSILKILDAMRSPKGNVLVNNAFEELLVTRAIFNPAENVNKFVTGGVAEDVMTELISDLGFKTDNVAATTTVIDIRVEVPHEGTIDTVGISLKNSGDIKQQPILENYRAESKSEIRPLPPTLIVYTATVAKRVRIVYIDHEIMRAGYPGLTDAEFNATVYNNTDSNLSFKSGFLASFIPRLPDSYIVNAVYPEVLPKVNTKSMTRLALEYVRSEMAKAREVKNG